MYLVFVRYIVHAKTSIASVCVVTLPIAHFQALSAHVIYKTSGKSTQEKVAETHHLPAVDSSWEMHGLNSTRK